MPPETAKVRRNQLAILLMVNSHKITLKQHLRPECEPLIGPYAEDIWPQFFEIFGDNCERKRRIFFKEPLVSHLWAQFRHLCSEDITELLSKTCDIKTREGRLRMKLFTREIVKMEVIAGLKS